MEISKMYQVLLTSALLATSIGVFLGVWQLWRTKVQSLTSFEDQLAREYRQIARDIPVDALLGREIPEENFEKVREQIFNYIDLSNEQVFLRQIGRVSKRSWDYWREGIESNLSKPTFAKVWSEVKDSDKDVFRELRMLEQKDSASDPRKWDRQLLKV